MPRLRRPNLFSGLFLTAALVLATPALAQGELPPRELAVLAPPEIAGVYPAGSADFDADLPPEGVTGLLVHVEDGGTESGEACGPITNAGALAGNVALVRRGECHYALKAEFIDSETDAIAVVIYNDERVPDDDTTLVNMICEGFCSTVDIPVAFVSRATGLLLLGALATDPVTVRLQPEGFVDAEDGPEPSALSLATYPNPAQGEATLALTLPEAAHVRAEAFDVLGRRVALVHDGPLGAGPHALRLDTGALPAGVYVVRATVGEAMITRRVVVR